MKTINPSVKLLTQKSGYSNMLKHIELCGRVCYKSESKITDTSSVPFVNMIIKSGHLSVLEHGAVYLKINRWNPFLAYIRKKLRTHRFTRESKSKFYCYYSTNYRAILELNLVKESKKYWCDFNEEYHTERVTFNVITRRSLSPHWIRHRIFSISQESQRYCNYSSEKFGKHVTFILPKNYTEEFKNKCIESEQNYFKALQEGKKPEEARDLLIGNVKTELNLSAFVDDWANFLVTRSPKCGAKGVSEETANLADKVYEILKDYEDSKNKNRACR